MSPFPSGAEPGSADPLRVGRRVVVRHRRPSGSQPPLTDVVGVVRALDQQSVTLETSRGLVSVDRADFVAVKAVPPAPVRRGRPHTAIGGQDLERVMADGWRAVEEEWLGDWLLRASSGFTSRGNSVLPLGGPGTDLVDAIDHAEAWYADRGLPARFHVDLPPSGDVVEDELGAELLSRGYDLVRPTLVMTGASSDVDQLTSAAVPVNLDATLSLPWLETYARQRPVTPGVTEQVLTGSPGQLFASTTGTGGEITAVARVSVHPGWAGIHGLWVDPEHRRRGLARTVVRTVGRLAREQRMASVYLQVEADNHRAVALFESEGFRTHHTYAYLVAPT